jgi:hypothetical protein
MRLKHMLPVGVVVVAATSVAVQAGAGARSAIHVSGTYTVDVKAKVKNVCAPLSKANPAVLRCTSSGFTLVWAGSLHGRSVISYRGIINCTTGQAYTDGTETFTGSVEGVGSGTSSWGVQYHGTFDCKKGEVTSTSATENLYSGTGALASLYGSIHRGPGKYAGVLSS